MSATMKDQKHKSKFDLFGKTTPASEVEEVQKNKLFSNRKAEVNENACSKEKSKKKDTQDIILRFVKTKDNDYGLSANQLGFKDIEGAKDLSTNISFDSGVHVWELIFPVCISGVEFGVKSLADSKKFSRKFKTTTPRFVSVTLDVEKKKLTYRLNKDPFTDKAIPIEGNGPFSPFASTTRGDIAVILNPYPRLFDHQKILGKQFNLRQHIRGKLANTFALSHLPKKLIVNSDSALISNYFELNENQIESIHLPRDGSHFNALRGWCLVKISSKENYTKWVSKSVSAEGKKLIIHKTEELVDYAFDQSLHEKLRGELKQIAEYVHKTSSEEEKTYTEMDVLTALNSFYLKAQEVMKGEFISNPQNLTFHDLHDGGVLVINEEGRAKVVHKGQEREGLNFEHGPRSVNENVLVTLSKDEVQTLFRCMDGRVVIGKHSEILRAYVEYFDSATASMTLSGTDGNLMEFSVPLKSTKVYLDDILNYLTKLRVSRSKEFDDLSVIGIDENSSLRSKKDESQSGGIPDFPVLKAVEPDISVHDINTVLNIFYKLDEQLWCKAAFNSKSSEISSLFKSVSRPNSAFERLSTFIGERKFLFSAASYGYIFREDNCLQNVFNEKEIKQISENCHNLISDSLLLKNNINIGLESSLNYIPPTNLSHKKLIISPNSDFVFKFTEKGICKVYTSNMGLVEVGVIDFSSESDVSSATENKKYICQLIGFEISNAKAKVSFSNSNTINIKKEKLTPYKGSDVINKYKPKKGPKTTVKKTPNKTVQYDEDEEVYDIGGLFGEDTEEYESVEEVQKVEEKDETEETKTTEEKKAEPDSKPTNFKTIGFSAMVNTDFRTQERQACVSHVYESEGDLFVESRALAIQLQPRYLRWCDFMKYGASNLNKKKNERKVMSEIISSYRENIVHYIPFYFNRPGVKESPVLEVSHTTNVKISDEITAVISILETNSDLTESNYLYILGVDKTGKVKLLKLHHDFKDDQMKTTIEGSVEISSLKSDVKASLTVTSLKVAISTKDKIIIVNARKLDEQHEIKVDGELTQSVIDNAIKNTEVTKIEKPKEEDKKEDEKEKKENKKEKKEENKEEAKTEKQPEEPEEKKDISVELLKRNDCDLRELDKIFISTPLGVASEQRHEGNSVLIEDNFCGQIKDFDKLKIKLLFNSKSSLPNFKNSIPDDSVAYKKKESHNVYERLDNISLKVHSNTGSQISPTHSATTTIDPTNKKSYISNYPRPTIIYSHQQGSSFLPVQFTVSSKFHREKSNADSYPVGSGLLFCANSLSELANVKKYYSIQTREQYEAWLQNRRQLRLPLRENEPIAFFDLGAEHEITVSIEEART